MSSIYYHRQAVIRETKRGAICWHYHFFESFGRDTAYARSWGCREQRGTGLIWARPGETFNEAIARRRAELS
jgi:hypothetical protein